MGVTYPDRKNQDSKHSLRGKAPQPKKQKAAKAAPASLDVQHQNPKTRTPISKGETARRAPAATFDRFSMMKLGLPNFNKLKLNWLHSQVYVGDGSLGTTDVLYLKDNTTVPSTIWSGTVPVPLYQQGITTGASPFVPDYMTSLTQLFSQVKIHDYRIRVVPQHSSTALDGFCLLAPFKGAMAGQKFDAKADTGVPDVFFGSADLLGADGVCSFNMWEGCELNLTPYISGLGPQQNIFNLRMAGIDTVTGDDLSFTAQNSNPTNIVLTGTNYTAALRGMVTHFVIVSATVDLIDFVGGLISGGWAGASRGRVLKSESALRAAQAKDKVSKDTKDVKAVAASKPEASLPSAAVAAAAFCKPLVVDEVDDSPVVVDRASKIDPKRLSKGGTK